MTWHEAMDRYGVDKPDLRFGMELVELTDGLRRDRVQGVPGARASRASGCRGRGRLRPQQARRAHRPGQGARGQGPGVDEGAATTATLDSPGGQVPVRGRAGRRWSSALGAEAGDLLLLVADEWHTGLRGARHAAQRPRPPAGARGPVPLRVGRRLPDVRRASTTTGQPKPGHHPFTRPHPDDLDRLESDPMAVRSLAYDLVLNGWELGLGLASGSTSRTCSSGSSTCSASPRRRPTGASGSSSTPFRYGAPPHGGFAFGIDRLVAILAGEENIREVIAFPKPQSGTDPMTGAPTPVDEHLADLGIRLLPPTT